MKVLVLASLAGLAMAGATVANAEPGYPDGALGLAAMQKGDWKLAEAQLAAPIAATNDPARLINLGQVYMKTGRTAQAIAAWEKALASPNHFLVTLADGRVVSTKDAARAALARYQMASLGE